MSDMGKKEVVPDAVVKIEQVDPFSPSNNAIVLVAEQDLFLQIIERGWLPENVRSIALMSSRNVDRALLEQLDYITEISNVSISRVVRAVEGGLDLENVGRALVAINILNDVSDKRNLLDENLADAKKALADAVAPEARAVATVTLKEAEKTLRDFNLKEERARLSLHSAIDWTIEAAPYDDLSLTEVQELNEKLAKNPKLAKQLKEDAKIKLIMRLKLWGKEDKHFASCGNIDEEVLNKFINQFRLNETYDSKGIETSEELSNAIKKVYKYAGQNSLNGALEKALNVAESLSPDIQQDIHSVLEALVKEGHQRRDIRKASRLRDTGVREDRDLSEETF